MFETNLNAIRETEGGPIAQGEMLAELADEFHANDDDAAVQFAVEEAESPDERDAARLELWMRSL